MMIQQYEKITDVSTFCLGEGSVAYVDTQSLFEKSLYLDGKFIASKAADYSIREGKLIYSTWEHNSYVYDLVTGESSLFAQGFDCLPDTCQDGKVFISQSSGGETKVSLYDFHAGMHYPVKGRSVGQVLGQSRLILTDDRHGLECLDFEGAPKWRYTLPAHYDWMRQTFRSDPAVKVRAKVYEIPGEYRKVLWAVVRTKKIALLGLDIETGEELFFINQPDHFFSDFLIDETKWGNPFGNQTKIDAESGIVFGVFNHFYGEVHLNAPQPEYHLYDVRESCEEHRMMMNKFGAWEGDRIYFWDGTSSNRFAVFSRAAKEIIWSGQIEEAANTCPAIRSIDYAQGKLYVLDHHHTLHIFQVEG
jgi:hypothetical protein